MDVRTVSLFLALLAVVAQATVVARAGLALLARVSPAAVRARTAFDRAVGPSALGLAFAVAATATAGSLYFSEVAHFPPCELCWYQRIAMYPLVPLLGIAAWRRDTAIRPYATVLAALGAAVSAYHVLLERFPTLASSGCDPTNPCTLIWVRRFGYLTIPAMALTAFLLILVLLRTQGDPE
jgi:disulfide bond formation protein DsbB